MSAKQQETVESVNETTNQEAVKPKLEPRDFSGTTGKSIVIDKRTGFKAKKKGHFYIQGTNGSKKYVFNKGQKLITPRVMKYVFENKELSELFDPEPNIDEIKKVIQKFEEFEKTVPKK